MAEITNQKSSNIFQFRESDGIVDVAVKVLSTDISIIPMDRSESNQASMHGNTTGGRKEASRREENKRG